MGDEAPTLARELDVDIVPPTHRVTGRITCSNFRSVLVVVQGALVDTRVQVCCGLVHEAIVPNSQKHCVAEFPKRVGLFAESDIV